MCISLSELWTKRGVVGLDESIEKVGGRGNGQREDKVGADKERQGRSPGNVNDDEGKGPSTERGRRIE